MINISEIRPYAIGAFRRYAITGSSVKYKQKIYDEAIAEQQKKEGKSGISNPSEAAVMHAENALDKAAAYWLDLEAVENTILHIERTDAGNLIMQALKTVYMAEPHKKLQRGEISERVHKAEIHIPASDRTIYRWLNAAVVKFAEERRLNI